MSKLETNAEEYPKLLDWLRYSCAFMLYMYGISILALNSGTGGDTPTKAQAFLERKKLGLVGAIDLPENQDFNSDASRSAATSLGMKTMPVLYILDSSGRLRVIHSGFDSSEPLTKSLSRKSTGC
jgi:hypothetical protein